MVSFTTLAIKNLLIEKGVITEEEFDAEFKKLKKAEWDERHQPPRSLEDQVMDVTRENKPMVNYDDGATWMP